MSHVFAELPRYGQNRAMAKRPPPGRCVHCLRNPAHRNWDHVFPAAWYPDTTPENIDKWKVPSCVECNSELGRIESRFISLIALTLDPKAQEGAGIPERVLRSMNPKFARNENDARARSAAAKRLTASIHRGPFEPENVYPTPGAEVAQTNPDAIPLLIPAELFRKVTEKIVRGITYVETGNFIEPPLTVKFYPDGPDMPKSEFMQSIRARGKTLDRGPGIQINYVVAAEDGLSGLFEIVFWGGQIKTYASVIEEDASDFP
jgi:hypothetical protein